MASDAITTIDENLGFSLFDFCIEASMVSLRNKLRKSLRRPRFDCVYFIYARRLGLTKIGYTADPVNRFFEIQTCCPVPVELLLVRSGGRECERHYHKCLADFREHGEWFRCCDDAIVELVKSKLEWQAEWNSVAPFIPGCPLVMGGTE